MSMNRTVIVIDDSMDVTEVVSEMLEFSSIDVVAKGHNGKAAVELYEKHRPDVVLMDHAMPNYDGVYGLENILKINPNAKVILLTGSIEHGLHDRLKEIGASIILTKPYGMKDLVDLIHKLPLDVPLSAK